MQSKSCDLCANGCGSKIREPVSIPEDDDLDGEQGDLLVSESVWGIEELEDEVLVAER